MENGDRPDPNQPDAVTDWKAKFLQLLALCNKRGLYVGEGADGYLTLTADEDIDPRKTPARDH